MHIVEIFPPRNLDDLLQSSSIPETVFSLDRNEQRAYEQYRKAHRGFVRDILRKGINYEALDSDVRKSSQMVLQEAFFAVVKPHFDAMDIEISDCYSFPRLVRGTVVLKTAKYPIFEISPSQMISAEVYYHFFTNNQTLSCVSSITYEAENFAQPVVYDILQRAIPQQGKRDFSIKFSGQTIYFAPDTLGHRFLFYSDIIFEKVGRRTLEELDALHKEHSVSLDPTKKKMIRQRYEKILGLVTEEDFFHKRLVNVKF
jgi:hypothetical protein